VLEQEEEYLADSAAILQERDRIAYWQVGLKLSHVNWMLSNLPVEAPANAVDPRGPQAFGGRYVHRGDRITPPAPTPSFPIPHWPWWSGLSPHFPRSRLPRWKAGRQIGRVARPR